MRVVIIDQNASRAALVSDALSAVGDCTLTVITEMRELVTRISAARPDVVLIDFANPARDMLEEHFAASRALARPITLFVDEATSAAIDGALRPTLSPASRTKKCAPCVTLRCKADDQSSLHRVPATGRCLPADSGA